MTKQLCMKMNQKCTNIYPLVPNESYEKNDGSMEEDLASKTSISSYSSLPAAANIIQAEETTSEISSYTTSNQRKRAYNNENELCASTNLNSSSISGLILSPSPSDRESANKKQYLYQHSNNHNTEAKKFKSNKKSLSNALLKITQHNSSNKSLQLKLKQPLPVATAATTASTVQQVKLCEVCEGESGTGNHYGAFTCNSCRDFFKRAVQLKFSFECLYDENCPIRENRLKCRRCRLLCCFRAGMKPHDQFDANFLAVINGRDFSAPASLNVKEEAVSSSTDKCSICDDLSTGYYYGVNACTQCAKFYSKYCTSQSQYSLTCQYQNDCNLAESIKKCPKCRFDKYKGLIERIKQENSNSAHVDKRLKSNRLNRTVV
jgi:hypothetical protein